MITVSDIEEGVKVITLDDPDRRNAMGAQMAGELRRTVAESDRDATRALVITGSGTAFCAGADLPELFGDRGRPVARTHAVLQEYYRAFLDVADLRCPTIAAVNGPAVGAGLNLAMACDIRIAGREAAFGATFSRIGLHPGGGATWFLVRAMGASRALQTLLLGTTLDAEQAVRSGLAEGPEDDCVAVARDMAGRIAALDPALSQSIKRAVGIAVTTGDRQAVLEFESWAQAASASSQALQAWVDRFR